MQTPAKVLSSAPHGNQLVASEGFQSYWKRVTVENIGHGQPRPYADSDYRYKIMFEGGTPSAQAGFDIPFTYFTDRERVEPAIRLLARGWNWEKGDKERPWHEPYLETLEVVDEGPGYAVWYLHIRQPYLD